MAVTLVSRPEFCQIRSKMRILVKVLADELIKCLQIALELDEGRLQIYQACHDALHNG